MKKNIKDLFDFYSDETVDIRPCAEISPEKIIELTKKKIEEDTMNLTKHKKKISIPIIAAALLVVLSISVFAAHQFLSPKEVANQFEDYKLSEYFSKEDTTFVFEPQISKDYSFQLLGIVSGKNLSSFAEVTDDKSYIVGAISKTDGTALTAFPDVMVTPLVSGYKPWQVNAFTLGGGRQDFLYKGVGYFIFECDNIEIFADHTIYIAAYEGIAPGADQFVMESDGNIRFNDSYTGIKAMFTVPFDQSKANPEAVKKLFEENGLSDDTSNGGADLQDEDMEITTTEPESLKIIEIKNQ